MHLLINLKRITGLCMVLKVDSSKHLQYAVDEHGHIQRHQSRLIAHLNCELRTKRKVTKPYDTFQPPFQTPRR